MPLLETWRSHYHRLRIPRTWALNRHVRRVQRHGNVTGTPIAPNRPPLLAARGATADTAVSLRANNGQAPADGKAAASHPPQKYRYNRWWVTERQEFLHQEAIVEDPEVIARRRHILPDATPEARWKTPHKPTMDMMLPFAKVVDYSKDPDTKFLKPLNVPRWKDFMIRSKPVVPRTWY